MMVEKADLVPQVLNMKTVFVTDEVKSLTNKSGKKRKLNKTETLLALEKQKQLIEKFKEWVWKNPSRKERLHEIYDKKYDSFCYLYRKYSRSKSTCTICLIFHM